MKKAQGPGPLPSHSFPPSPTPPPFDRTARRRPAKRPRPRLRIVLTKRQVYIGAAVFAAVLLVGVLPALLGAYSGGAGKATPTPRATSTPAATATPAGPTLSPTPSPRPSRPVLPPQVTTLPGSYVAYAADYMYPPGYVFDAAGFASAMTTDKPLAGITVILDPGHGGTDGGTVYPMSNQAIIVEKTVALNVAARAKAVLEGLGATVVLTRSDDGWVSLYNRVAQVAQYVLGVHAASLESSGSRAWPDAAETLRLSALTQICIDKNSDYLKGTGLGPFKGYGVTPDVRQILDLERQHGDIVFVSLHCNANDNPAAKGVSVLYTSNRMIYREERSHSGTPIYRFYDDEGRTRLAQDVYDGIVARVPDLVSNGWMQPTFDQDLAVLREENLVGVLVEMGFVTNEKDRSIMLSDDGVDRIARGVADGLVDYFKGT